MGDVKATEYPDHVAPRDFNLVVQTGSTIPVAAIIPWFITSKSEWMDDLKYAVQVGGGVGAAVLTLKMAPTSITLDAGTTLATLTDLGAIVGGALTSATKANTNGFSRIRIPANYQVGFVVSGAELPATLALCVMGLFRQKAQ